MLETIVALVGSIIGIGLFVSGFLLGLKMKPEPRVVEKHILPPISPTYPPTPTPVKAAPNPPKSPKPDPGRFILNPKARPTRTEEQEAQRMGELLNTEPEV